MDTASSLPSVDRPNFLLRRDDDDDVLCGLEGGDDRFLGLRIAALFIILASFSLARFSVPLSLLLQRDRHGCIYQGLFLSEHFEFCPFTIV
jgi:hypothetical protein